MCVGALLACSSAAFVLSSSRTIIAHAPTRVNLAPTMETIGVGDISVPRSSPLALQTLRDMASISAALREMQQTVRPMAEHGLPAQQAELLATLNAGVGELQTSVAALQSVADGANVSEPNDGPQPEDVATLRAQAQRLQRETQSQSQVLLLLEEQESGSPERAQEVFSLMDVNNDGQVSEDEFLRGMTALLTLGKGETELLRKDVAERFRKATPDAPGGTGTMDFALFCDFLASLKGDAIGPLRVNLADALRRLLDNSLQMTSLSLSKELASPDLPPDRVRELSDYVDTWVELEGRATAAIAKGSTDPVQKAMLQEVGALASALSLPATCSDVGCTVDSRARRLSRQMLTALVKFRASLAFCWRGLRVTGQDLLEVGLLLGGWFQGATLEPKQADFCRRTAADVALLVPYSIICIVPLSPPGHIFAFSLMNRCFPGAVPSGFTERRQDMYDIYKRIATQARQQDRMRSTPDPVRWAQRARIKVSNVSRRLLSFGSGRNGTSTSSEPLSRSPVWNLRQNPRAQPATDTGA